MKGENGRSQYVNANAKKNPEKITVKFDTNRLRERSLNFSVPVQIARYLTIYHNLP